MNTNIQCKYNEHKLDDVDGFLYSCVKAEHESCQYSKVGVTVRRGCAEKTS